MTNSCYNWYGGCFNNFKKNSKTSGGLYSEQFERSGIPAEIMWRFIMLINMKYIETYIKTKGSPEKLVWDIVIEYIEKDLLL